jgi:hypothetical protein
MDEIYIERHGHEEDEDEDDGDDEGIVAAPSLYKRTTFFRQTRKRGKVFKTVVEQYIRDDLGLGCYFVDDGENKKTRRVKDAIVGKPRDIATTAELLTLLHKDDGSETTTLVICDTNVLLHNLDVLEQAPIRNLVIQQTSLQECQPINLPPTTAQSNSCGPLGISDWFCSLPISTTPKRHTSQPQHPRTTRTTLAFDRWPTITDVSFGGPQFL